MWIGLFVVGCLWLSGEVGMVCWSVSLRVGEICCYRGLNCHCFEQHNTARVEAVKSGVSSSPSAATVTAPCGGLYVGAGASASASAGSVGMDVGVDAGACDWRSRRVHLVQVHVLGPLAVVLRGPGFGGGCWCLCWHWVPGEAWM